MRVKRGVTTHKRHKKIIKLTKGYSKIRRASYRKAHEAVIKALAYQYRDRRNIKRDMRSLWVTRINAAARSNDTTYSKFMEGMKKADIKLDRKILSELAVNNPVAFEAIVKASK
ncbi:MAG TPA: 50S ribosomal protein L20 [Candidatus Saccharibacteria bacterium]|nr:50S ribosomal protein L20 [Candidatus Saccharibacteria bacterium]HMT39544.1 50S ribosomal protein L20 [Candidatus Saccharibacteria bacterium]